MSATVNCDKRGVGLRVAITGSRGYIGRSLYSYLRDLSVDVIRISRTLKGGDTKEADDHYCVDYSNLKHLAALLSGCDVVIHLAGLAHKNQSEVKGSALASYRNANLDPLIYVARAASEACVRRVVFVSSIGVNGKATNGIAFTEKDGAKPEEVYSLTKQEAEIALIRELEMSSTQWVIIRPPLVYGPGCPGNMHKLCKISTSWPLIPFGSFKAKRSFIDIENLLSALWVASTHHLASGQIFLVADFETINLNRIFRIMLKMSGRGSWRLKKAPKWLLHLAMLLLGKNDIYEKLSSELLIDPSHFSKLCDWVPLQGPSEGIKKVMAAYIASRRES